MHQLMVIISSCGKTGKIYPWQRFPAIWYDGTENPKVRLCLTSNRQSWTSRDKLDKLALFCCVVGAQYFKEELNGSAVVRVAVVRAAAIHQLCRRGEE